MAAPTVTITGTLTPIVDGGYVLAELSQSVMLTDVSTPAVAYKTIPAAIKGKINTDGRLMAFGATDPTSNPYALPPCKGTLVSPSYGAYYKIRIVTTKDDLTTKTKELWEIDSSFSTIEVSSINVIAALPINFFMHNQLTGRDADDHTQYMLADGTRVWGADQAMVPIGAPSAPSTGRKIFVNTLTGKTSAVDSAGNIIDLEASGAAVNTFTTDLAFTTPTVGALFQAPDASIWRLTMDNSGALITSVVP
jgi:hypothetical protein